MEWAYLYTIKTNRWFIYYIVQAYCCSHISEFPTYERTSESKVAVFSEFIESVKCTARASNRQSSDSLS